jgi:transcriptional regulator with XRE-family HTH domain
MDIDIRIEIADRLRYERRIRGLRQTRVAELSGIGVKTISSFETAARVDCMKVSQLLAILGVYGLTASSFFEMTEKGLERGRR